MKKLLLLLLLWPGFAYAQAPGTAFSLSGGLTAPTGKLADEEIGTAGIGLSIEGRLDFSMPQNPRVRLGFAGSFNYMGSDPFVEGSLVSMDGHWQAFNLDGQLRFLAGPLGGGASPFLFGGAGLTFLKSSVTGTFLGQSETATASVDPTGSLIFGAGIQALNGVFVQGSYRYIFSNQKNVDYESSYESDQLTMGYDANWLELRIGYAFQAPEASGD